MLTVGFVAHPCLPGKLCKIHKYVPFDGMLCFEIVHSTEGRQIWRQNGKKFYIDKNNKVVKELKKRVTLGCPDYKVWELEGEEE